MLVKNEGVLLCVLNIMTISAFALKRCLSGTERKITGSKIFKAFLTLVFPFWLLLVPLAIQRYFFGAENYDFALSQTGKMNSSEFIRVFLMSASKTFENLFFDIRANLVFAFLIPPSIILLIKGGKRRCGSTYCFLLASIYISVIAGSFIFSMRPLLWHINSLSRVMLIPELIILLGVIVSTGFSNRTEETFPE